jgi:radical SAM protein with 4Fe4S-binding SPASM domain
MKSNQSTNRNKSKICTTIPIIPESHHFMYLDCGSVCNNNCLFCIQKKIRCNRSTNSILKDIRRTKKECDRIHFTGGEPTLRKDIVQLVSYAKRLNFQKIRILSNGRMFSYPSLCKRLAEAGMNEAYICIYGHNAAMHDFHTRTQGSFFQTIHGIKNLARARIDLTANVVITKLNYMYLETIVSMLSRLGVHSINMDLVDVTNCDNAPKDAILPFMSDTIPFIKKAIHTALENGVNILVEAVPACLLSDYSQFLNFFEHGPRVSVSKRLYGYSTHKKGFYKKFEQCPECKYFSRCLGTWKSYASLYGTGEFKPILPFVREVRFEVTPKCNLNCAFCYNRSYSFAKNGRENLENLDTEKVKEILDRLRDEDVRTIHFLGGECLVRRDFSEILGYAFEMGFTIKLTTNGTLINRRNVESIRRYVKQTILSLHGRTPEDEYAVSGNDSAAWNKKVDAIKLLVDNGCRVTVISVITRKSLGNLEKFLLFLRGMKVFSWIVLRPMPDKKEPQPIDKEYTKTLVETLCKIEKKYGQHIDIGNPLLLCDYDPEKVRHFLTHRCFNNEERMITVNYLGDVVPCELIPVKIGNILDKDRIEDCWNQSSIIQGKISLESVQPKCRKCRYLAECRGGCVAMSNLVK